ncbi:MAG: glutaredoxin [Patescibacteria group bacterium]
MKKFLFAFALAFLFPNLALATTTLEVFERDDCQHCLDFLEFMDDLALERNDFELVTYDIYEEEGKTLFNEVTESWNLVKSTPIIYLNEKIISGFDSAETTGQQILAELDAPKENARSLRELLDSGEMPEVQNVEKGGCTEDECAPGSAILVTLPFIKKTINVAEFSLPVMSLVLGTVDGFNPCAMWVLVMFLTILVGLGSKRKMWEFIGLFLLAEAIMYYLILNVWLYAWDFIGLDRIITPLVSLLSIGAGLYFLREWYKRDDTCKVIDPKERSKMSARVKDLASKPLTLVTAVGIVGLALSVNIFEFACSIGIPQTFTKILDINSLNFAVKQVYNAIYILGYMLDDFLVFGIAVFSFEKIGLTKKYTRWSHLIGGVLMVTLGLIMLLKPEWLVF